MTKKLNRFSTLYRKNIQFNSFALQLDQQAQNSETNLLEKRHLKVEIIKAAQVKLAFYTGM